MYFCPISIPLQPPAMAIRPMRGYVIKKKKKKNIPLQKPIFPREFSGRYNEYSLVKYLFTMLYTVILLLYTDSLEILSRVQVRPTVLTACLVGSTLMLSSAFRA